MAPGLKKRSDKDSYAGEKRNHLRDGYGVYIFSNSFFRYEGQWKEGKKHGHGKLLMKDGSFYEGEFQDGEIAGHGFRYWGASRNTYAGEFQDGECHGQGTMRYHDGSTYEGSWHQNKRQGAGRLTYTDGSVYEGQFHDHKRHGEGKMFYIDGALYEGDFIQDKRQGSGIMKFSDGSLYDGQWRSDLFNGEGTLLHCSGFMYEGMWVNGRPSIMAARLATVGIEGNKMDAYQGEAFEIKVVTLSEDGTPVADHGRELRVHAGYRHYRPKEHKKESGRLFDAIEDLEERPVPTPFGYSVVSYPLTELRQDLIESLSKVDTFIVDDEASDERGDAAEGEGADEQNEAPSSAAASKADPAGRKDSQVNDALLTTGHEDSEKSDAASAAASESSSDKPAAAAAASAAAAEELLSPPPYGTRRTAHGEAVLSSLFLPPPPPLYRPYALQEDEAQSKGSGSPATKVKATRGGGGGGGAATASKPVLTEAKAKPSKSSSGSTGKATIEKYPRIGDYVVMIEDVTNPPFMGVTLPPLFVLVHLKKKRRAPHATKTKVDKITVKWDTSKHIQQSAATHRESSILLELTSSIDGTRKQT